jgi:hypothetical protein
VLSIEQKSPSLFGVKCVGRFVDLTDFYSGQCGRARDI